MVGKLCFMLSRSGSRDPHKLEGISPTKTGSVLLGKCSYLWVLDPLF